MRQVLWLSALCLVACSPVDSGTPTSLTDCDVELLNLEQSIRSEDKFTALAAFKEATDTCETPAGDLSNLDILERILSDELSESQDDAGSVATVGLEPEPESKPEPEPEKPKSEWIKRVDASEMTDEKSVFLSLIGSSVPGSYGDSIYPLMSLRCNENKTSFYIDWDDYLGDDTNDVYTDEKYMRIRLDKEKPFRRLYPISTDNEAAGLWSGATSIPFIKQMIGKKKMVVEVIPYNESPKTTTFNIEGLDDEIVELRETCGW